MGHCKYQESQNFACGSVRHDIERKDLHVNIPGVLSKENTGKVGATYQRLQVYRKKCLSWILVFDDRKKKKTLP